MQLWLARHAQPLIAPGICYGQLDVAADAAATAACAHKLASVLPLQIKVVTSTRQRCQQLAQALQKLRPALSYSTDTRLQEMDFGHWEGHAWENIPPAELAAWTDNFPNYAVGQIGENVSVFMARVAEALDMLKTPQNQNQHPYDQTDVLWITHAGVIRATELLMQGIRHIEHAHQWPKTAPNYGQWRTYEHMNIPSEITQKNSSNRLSQATDITPKYLKP